MAARQRLLQHLRARWPWLDAATAGRWVRAYGTLVLPWLQDARGPHDLGR
jgi:hypothetical protein